MKFQDVELIVEWIREELKYWSNFQYLVEINQDTVTITFTEVFSKETHIEMDFRVENGHIEFYSKSESWQDVSSFDRYSKFFWIDLLSE